MRKFGKNDFVRIKHTLKRDHKKEADQEWKKRSTEERWLVNFNFTDDDDFNADADDEDDLRTVVTAAKAAANGTRRWIARSAVSFDLLVRAPSAHVQSDGIRMKRQKMLKHNETGVTRERKKGMKKNSKPNQSAKKKIKVLDTLDDMGRQSTSQTNQANSKTKTIESIS